MVYFVFNKNITKVKEDVEKHNATNIKERYIM